MKKLFVCSWIGISIALSGCTQTSPELSRIAMSAAISSPSISGDTLLPCIEKLSWKADEPAPTSARFAPSVTNSIAQTVHARGAPVLAQAIRVYSTPIHGRNLLGLPVDNELLCIYATKSNGQLEFLTSKQVHGGRMDGTTWNGLIYTVMRKGGSPAFFLTGGWPIKEKRATQ